MREHETSNLGILALTLRLPTVEPVEISDSPISGFPFHPNCATCTSFKAPPPPPLQYVQACGVAESRTVENRGVGIRETDTDSNSVFYSPILTP